MTTALLVSAALILPLSGTPFGLVTPQTFPVGEETTTDHRQPMELDRDELSPQDNVVFQLDYESGALVMDGKFDYGGYATACNGSDWGACTADEGYSYLTIAPSDYDYFATTGPGSGACDECNGGTDDFDPEIEMLYDQNKWGYFWEGLIRFEPNNKGICSDVCEEQGASYVEAFNSLSFSAQEINNKYGGNVDIDVYFVVTPITKITDSCDANSSITINGDFKGHSPTPSLSAFTPCPTVSIDTYDIVPYSGGVTITTITIDESNGLSPTKVHGPWTISNIAQGQTFSVGFKISVEGANFHGPPGNMYVAIKVREAD